MDTPYLDLFTALVAVCFFATGTVLTIGIYSFVKAEDKGLTALLLMVVIGFGASPSLIFMTSWKNAGILLLLFVAGGGFGGATIAILHSPRVLEAVEKKKKEVKS